MTRSWAEPDEPSWENAVEALDLAVVVQGRDRTVRRASPAAVRLLRLGPTELAGEVRLGTGWHVVDESGNPLHDDAFPTAYTLDNGSTVTDELLGVRWPDGESRWLRVSAKPILGAHGAVLAAVATFEEVHDRPAFDTLNNPQSVEELDAATVGYALISASGAVLRVNDGLVELLGRPEHEISASGLPLAVTREDPSAIDINQRLLSGELNSYRATRLFVHGDGSLRRGVVAASVVAGEDSEQAVLWRVVASKALDRAQRALATSEALLAAVLETAVDGIIVIDERGRIESFSEGAKRIFGYTPEEVLGQNVSMLMPASDAARHDQYIASYLAGGPPKIIGSGREVIGLRKNGTTVVLDLSISEVLVNGRRVFTGICRDISERKKAEQALRESEQRFRSVFEAAPVGMGVLGSDWTFIESNRALADQLCRLPDELPETPLLGVTHPDDRPGLTRGLEELASGERERFNKEVKLLRPDRDVRWALLHITRLRQTPLRLLVQLLDVTERHNFEEHLRHMADHDPLTGLRNRRSFEQALKDHCAFVSRYGPQGALLILDLDNFKFVNDSLGHNAGDEVIVGVARVLKERLRETDILARLGGDEFAVLLPTGGAAEASAVAAALAEAIQNHTRYDIGSAQRSVTTSIGIALFDDPNVTADMVMVAADLAMYDAKEEGRNRFALAVTDQHPRSRTGSRITWAERIEAALADDGFVLVAQPILDLREDRVNQYELLVRMRGKNGDLIPPAAFLYIAERVDLIQHIDRWVAEQAIKLLANDDRIKLEINISGKSLTDHSLLELLDSALVGSGIQPDRLIFEVTETAAVADIARARHFAEHLTGLGCRFALDDFGAGFGSFYYLKYLPFDFLKIDGEFIANCTTSAMDQTIVRGLVSISRELGKQTIAEYTHDAPTLSLVRQLGVDHAQGYHISPPVPLGVLLTPTPEDR